MTHYNRFKKEVCEKCTARNIDCQDEKRYICFAFIIWLEKLCTKQQKEIKKLKDK